MVGPETRGAMEKAVMELSVNQNKPYDYLRNIVSDGREEAALYKLLETHTGNNEIILLLAHLKHIDNQRAGGVIRDEEFELQMNRIRMNILNLIGKMEEVEGEVATNSDRFDLKKDELKKGVINGIEGSIKKVASAINENSKYKPFIAEISEKYFSVNRSAIQGSISAEDAYRSYAQIRQQLLTFIDSLEESDLSPPRQSYK
jgi:hypothetical protein